MPALAKLISNPGKFPADQTNKVEVLATDAVMGSISSVVPETGSRTHYEQLFQRVINANFRVGQKDHAAALAKFSTDARVPVSLRVEALQALGDWAKPSEQPGRRVSNQAWRKTHMVRVALC